MKRRSTLGSKESSISRLAAKSVNCLTASSKKKDHVVHLQPETLALHFQFTEIEQLVYQIEQTARIIVNRFQLLFSSGSPVSWMSAPKGVRIKVRECGTHG